MHDHTEEVMTDSQWLAWGASTILLAYNPWTIPMVRHLAHPETEEALCGAQDDWEFWSTPIEEFDPTQWKGCPACGVALHARLSLSSSSVPDQSIER